MSKLTFRPPAMRGILKMSREEIFNLFAWYEFKDKLGHELTNCQDFIELVELAISSGAKDETRKPKQVSV
ncbi:MAG TPA: hypothetical protein VF644_06925 [Pyrinomonadaceae bacterium]|jgi:hypothetical protein